MALWTCPDCTAAYAVGVPACPQCGSSVHRDDGGDAAVLVPAAAVVPDGADKGTAAPSGDSEAGVAS